MKQVAQNYKSGELAVFEVPAPACKPGGVLVRSLYSLISTGTELMKVSEARMSLLGRVTTATGGKMTGFFGTRSPRRARSTIEAAS